MNGTLARLVTLAAFTASTLLLGACVAETGDEEPVAEGSAADGIVPLPPSNPSFTPKSPQTPGPLPGTPGSPNGHPTYKTPNSGPRDAQQDPEPSPWQPPGSQSH